MLDVGELSLLFSPVMARFMRATHPRAFRQLMRKDVGLGRPDKPGDDEIF
jgi:hypothetical protein